MLYKSRLLLLHGTCQFRSRSTPAISIYVFNQLHTKTVQYPLTRKSQATQTPHERMEILYGKRAQFPCGGIREPSQDYFQISVIGDASRSPAASGSRPKLSSIVRSTL